MSSFYDHVGSSWKETNGTRVMSASFHKNCRKWNAQAAKDGVIRSVFPSICDPFEDWQGFIHVSDGTSLMRCDYCGSRMLSEDNVRCMEPCGKLLRSCTMNDLRHELFEAIDACPHLRFLLLTKRPGNVLEMWPRRNCDGHGEKVCSTCGCETDLDGVCRGVFSSRPNVAIITSISDQATADAMIPLLLECRDLVPVLGVSYEPAIGEVHIAPWLYSDHDRSLMDNQYLAPLPGTKAAERFYSKIDWVIVDGESGRNARPFIMDWGHSVIQQCKAAGCPVFMKQVGSNPMINEHLSAKGIETSVWGPIKDSKGGVMEEWPLDSRVREMPNWNEVPA